MCGVGRLLARPRIGAQFTLRAAGVLSSCGMSAKLGPQILLRLRPRIVGLNEGRGCGGALSRSLFRGFAAKPRAALGIEGRPDNKQRLIGVVFPVQKPINDLMGQH